MKLRRTTVALAEVVRRTLSDRAPSCPWARGRSRVGAANATDVLARPLKGTLFFAGEATGSGGSTGTVDGAIATGRRAAKQLLRTFGE
jgi:monoamine oxidase